MRLVAALGALAALAGCATGGPAREATGGAAAPGFPLTITDAAGREHTFDAPPRIGCLWFGCTEIMADLGVPAHAGSEVAIEDDGPFYYPAGPPAEFVTDFTDPEDWARTGVEVIMHRVPETPENDALEQAAPVFYLHHPSYGESSETGVAAYRANLEILGRLTGRTEQAQAALARFDGVLDGLRAAAPPGAAGTTVAPMFSSDDGTYSVTGRENPFCVTLAENGLGQCVDTGDDAEVNAEAFLALDPDWIAYQVFADESWTGRVDPVWSRLTAVAQQQVYDAGNRIYCCSLRGLEHALQEYAHHVFGPEAGIPAPGPVADFDPAASPLAAA